MRAAIRAKRPERVMAITDGLADAAFVTYLSMLTSRSFTATADAQGNYSLPIEVPQDAGASFVTLNADGVGAQAFVELVSLAGDLSTLIAAAGSDGVLTAAGQGRDLVDSILAFTRDGVGERVAGDGAPHEPRRARATRLDDRDERLLAHRAGDDPAQQRGVPLTPEAEYRAHHSGSVKPAP